MKSFITSTLILINIICYSQILEYPQVIDSNNQIIKHRGYTLSYNETCEQANWVKYRVTGADLDNAIASRLNNFKNDNQVETGSASIADYEGSGYDRGHLAPAATFVNNQVEMNESFYMSNISPQLPSFNRGVWKRIENYERKLAYEHDTIYVITGGILNTNLSRIGENEVCVPVLYFKIIYNNTFSVCFLIKNQKSNDDINTFEYPINIIEKHTGIKFNL